MFRPIFAGLFLTEKHTYLSKHYMINLILFGPPGSGKGTQATQLAEKYNLVHISTGDLFRYELGNNTPLGLKAKEYMSKGELVPDAVTMGMLRNKIESIPDAKGFIFDGVPRTTPQAEILDAMLEEKDSTVTALVALIVPEEEIVKRLLLRGTTSGRADDSEEGVIRKRIRVYESETTPVFDYYDKATKSHRIDGLGTIEEIFERLCAKIDTVSK